MSDEIECPECVGTGSAQSPCDGPPTFGFVSCPACNGTGWREPTQDEADSMAEDAYQRQFEGEPPMSFAERCEMQAKRDAQWGVK
jgi:DnaJ-class molecular chaperone